MSRLSCLPADANQRSGFGPSNANAGIASLKVICDREGDFRALIGDGDVECVAHDDLCVQSHLNAEITKVRRGLTL